MLRRTILQGAGALALGLTLSLGANAAALGTDYVKLDQPLPGGEGKIVKIWSYDCPFCFKYDVGVDPKVMPEAEKATGLKFDMFHLETKGKFGRAASEFLAYCKLQDEKAGVNSVEDAKSLYKKAKDAWYQAYHKKGERWAAGEAAFLKTAEDATGIAPSDFDAARKSEAVQKLADSWKPSYDVAKIQGVPAYVVNGKYLLMTKSIRSVKGMVDTLSELSKM